jgi:hypothetical protein
MAIPFFDPAATTIVPGQREAGRLTRFAMAVADIAIEGPSSMDAATIADRQREGGGAPSERRPAVQARWAAWRRAAKNDA